MQWVIGYAGAAAAFLLLDGLWLGFATETLYRPAMGRHLAERFQPTAAVAFYLLYVGGIVALAVSRAGSTREALIFGAVLGAVAYGTYDLTNLATLRDWPGKLALVDLAWGTSATALAAVAGRLAMIAAGHA